MSFPALPRANVCAKALTQTAGNLGLPELLLGKAIRIHQLAHSGSHCLSLGLTDALTQGNLPPFLALYLESTFFGHTNTVSDYATP